MEMFRTDLAMERLSGLDNASAEGIAWQEWRQEPLSVHLVDVTNARGAQALDRPEGQYLTAQLDGDAPWDSQWMWHCAEALAALLRPLLPEAGPVLVAGLGNRAMTCDALGPQTLDHVMVTRHLTRDLPGLFAHMRPVCALAPGVLGTTGMESAELLRGAAGQTEPGAIIAIDALTARDVARLCCTFQLTDTGIIPGSGACNPRKELSERTLGVPVIALGVPTVVEARTLARDLCPRDTAGDLPQGGLLVSPKDIDLQVTRCAKMLGWSINLALHPDISLSEMEQFLA